jgi:hypothetical protein
MATRGHHIEQCRWQYDTAYCEFVRGIWYCPPISPVAILTVTKTTGIDILRRAVAIEALHNSGERFPEPACHPRTRTSILEELKLWSLVTDTESSLLWLHGSAGVGKSAIAQNFAGGCHT